MATWEYKIESVHAISENTQRFIIALYPDEVLFERSNIDVPTAEVDGLINSDLINALAPYVSLLIDEVTLNYDAEKAAQNSSAPIQDAVNALPDEFISIT